MQEMNDRARAANERHRENGRDDQEESNFGTKIPSRFVTEIFAADVEERRGRTTSGSAIITIQRERLKITVGNEE